MAVLARTKTHRLKPVPLKSAPPRNCATIRGESISCAHTQFGFLYALILLLAVAYGYDYRFRAPPDERAKTGRSIRCCDLPPPSRHPAEGQQSGLRVGRAIAHGNGILRSLPVSSLRVHSLLVHPPKVEKSHANDDCVSAFQGSSSTATPGCVGFAIDDDAWMCGSSENHTARSGCATKTRYNSFALSGIRGNT